MARVKTNADDIGRQLEAFVGAIDFHMQGETADLAEELIEIAWTGVRDRSAQGLGPDGHPWPANAPGYASYKAKRYQVHQVGELSGQMLSAESLKGQPLVQPDLIEMVYGTGDPPAGASRSGVELRDHEKIATDREKAEWFTQGGRPFYELDDQINDQLVDKAGDVIAANLTAEGW